MSISPCTIISSLFVFHFLYFPFNYILYSLLFHCFYSKKKLKYILQKITTYLTRIMYTFLIEVTKVTSIDIGNPILINTNIDNKRLLIEKIQYYLF